LLLNEEMAVFLADKSDGAYEKAIDRLLATPKTNPVFPSSGLLIRRASVRKIPPLGKREEIALAVLSRRASHSSG